MTEITEAVQQLKAYRENHQPLQRGKSPSLTNDTEAGGIIMAMVYSIFGTIAGAIAWGIYQKSVEAAFTGAEIGALAALVMYAVYPALSWVRTAFKNKGWPEPRFFNRFPTGQNFLCLLLLTWPVVYGFNHHYTKIAQYFKPASISAEITHPDASQNRHKSSLRHDRQLDKEKMVNQGKIENLPSLPIKSDWAWGLAWVVTALLLAEAISRINNRRLKKYLSVSEMEERSIKKPFRLWLGHSTGELAKLSHGAGVAPHQIISLSLEDAAHNVLVLGGIGSGKTTRAMHPLLLQCLDQDCGGLIFDIKGDFQKSVMFLVEHTQRSVVIIGVGHQRMNLLAGLTPEIAASFLKSIFLLNNKQNNDGFWLDTATELCRNTLGVLSFIPQHYSLQGLYSYLFDTQQRLKLDEEIEQQLPTLEEKSARLLASYWQYHEKIFDKFDEKVKAGVNATIAQVLSPFNHPDLVEAFCAANESQETQQAAMEAVLDGVIYLVSLPLSTWGLGAKVVYSLIKLRFYNVMQKRTTQTNWNQDRPVFFMCDEFQEIVSANKDGLSDLNFWDKSRSSKTIGIISAQAISSFYATIGDRDITHALLQNFRQKLCFRTEDTATLNYFNALADKVEVIRKSYSTTTGSQKQPGKWLSSSSSSTTENTSFIDKPVLSPQLFRKLEPNQAVVLLSVDGQSMDDVMAVMPIYV